MSDFLIYKDSFYTLYQEINFEGTTTVEGPLFCNFVQNNGHIQNKGPVPHISYKIKGTFMIVNMKMASFRIKKIWKFRIDNRSQDLFDDYLFLQEKMKLFFYWKKY